MAATLLSDVIVPEVWVPYTIEATKEKSALFRSGIISTDPRIDEKLEGGGDLINMPFFNDLSGDDHVRDTDNVLTVDKITTGKDVARLHGREKAWGVEDLAAELSGADPMRAIGDRVADYWARRMQVLLVATLSGVFADNIANDSNDLVNDVAEEDVNTNGAVELDGGVILDSKQKLGDAKNDLAAITMHSQVHTNLQKKQLVEYYPESDIDIGFGTFLGMTIIVDDEVPVEAATTSGTKYTSFIFGSGAIGYGEGPVKNPVEEDRDSLANQDILINRRNFILHPRGIKWTESSVAATFPTNTEVENAANWDRVYPQKNIRMVKIVTNG
ncbi:MAG: coat protein [Halanaerobiales bacterium]|nr:coat protein [Halanaerobiales bacterium]